MYMEEAIETIVKKMEGIEWSLEKLERDFQAGQNKMAPEYLTIQQAHDLQDWPFTGAATRKLISRKHLQEGLHYYKINGRVILRWNALKGMLDEHFLIAR